MAVFDFCDKLVPKIPLPMIPGLYNTVSCLIEFIISSQKKGDAMAKQLALGQHLG